MEDREHSKDLRQAEVNNEAEGMATKKTVHTWIGDKDEISPAFSERPVTRATFQTEGVRSTRLVEKEKKPYKGFITDEEVEFAEKAAEIDRRARAERLAARETMTQTRVYSGFGSAIEEEKPQAEETEKVRPHRRKSYNIHIADSRKFKRLIVLAAVLAVLLAFEISFVFMKAQISSLPDRTQDLRSRTEALQTENSELQKSVDEMGDYDQIKELRDSWQRIKDKLAE